MKKKIRVKAKFIKDLQIEISKLSPEDKAIQKRYDKLKRPL